MDISLIPLADGTGELQRLVNYPSKHIAPRYVYSGCVSTHWLIGERRLVNAMGAALPRAGLHRLYFDYGKRMVDRHYEPLQQWMDRWVQVAGYRQGTDWLTRKFEGAEHSERAWRVRVHIPLVFLLGD